MQSCVHLKDIPVGWYKGLFFPLDPKGIVTEARFGFKSKPGTSYTTDIAFHYKSVVFKLENISSETFDKLRSQKNATLIQHINGTIAGEDIVWDGQTIESAYIHNVVVTHYQKHDNGMSINCDVEYVSLKSEAVEC